jgi:ABC-type phosphate transport system auxiliary subunit
MLIKILITYFLFSANSAWAYLDPGSVSLSIQAIFAAIAIAVSTMRFWWAGMINFFKKILNKKTKK